MLSPEFVASEISVSETAPENALTVCRLLAKATSTLHHKLILVAAVFAESEIACRCRSSGPPHLNPLPTVGERRITTWSLSSIRTRGSPRECSPRAMLQRDGARSALARRQPESSNDPLEIVISVVLDLDPPALFSMVNSHVRPEMLLQPVL